MTHILDDLLVDHYAVSSLRTGSNKQSCRWCLFETFSVWSRYSVKRGPFTQARFHIFGRHEAVKAQTLVRSRGVGALASVTDLWALLTLVNI